MERPGAEPSPETWWERYGHRLSSADGGGDRPPDDPPDDPSGDEPDLADEAIIRDRPDRPSSGWRKAVLKISGGAVNPGPGAAELRHRELLHRIRRPLMEAHRVAVVSLKGGVGKTTVTTLLGLVLAESRGDRVIALDAHPEAGTLADRLTGESSVGVRQLVGDLDRVGSWSAVSHYTSLVGRLQVLASEQDPAGDTGVDRDDYERVSALLERFFDIIVTDSGTGLLHPAVTGTLGLADSLIVVGAPTVDAAGRASATLDWLWMHGRGPLAADAIVVLTAARSSADVDTARIREHFAARCRAVVEIPYDAHLAVGGRVELDRLQPATRDVAFQLAALVADRFSV